MQRAAQLAQALREIAQAETVKELERIRRWVRKAFAADDPEMGQIDQAYNEALNEIGNRAVVHN